MTAEFSSLAVERLGAMTSPRHTDADFLQAQKLLLGSWAAQLSAEYMNTIFPQQVQAVADALAEERTRSGERP